MIQTQLTNGRLTDQEILDYMNYNINVNSLRYAKNEAYFRGKNTKIIEQTDRETGMPDNRIPVPYARKIGMAVKNYLFSKDAVYTSPDKNYMATLNDVFYVNSHFTKSSKIGEDIIVNGVSYKIFYMDVLDGALFPRYTVIEQTEGVPIYSMDIEPVLIAFIRYYKINDISKKTVTTSIEVYYSDVIARYDYSKGTLVPKKEDRHDFKKVPVVVYGGDIILSVFEPVIPLIDAVDIILSSDLNEIQRFELLYLVLVGDKLPDDPAEVEKMVKRRIFELSENAQMSFLEKHIDSAFNMSLLDKIIELIHSMSGVPDFASKDFAAESGIALEYKLIGFEQVASEIEAIFIQGEMDSIDLINSLTAKNEGLLKGLFNRFVFWRKNPDKTVDIELMRNLPQDTKARLEEAVLMGTIGVSKETILDYVPMVEDVEEEMKRIEEQGKKDFEAFKERQIPPAEPKLPITDDEDVNVVQQ